MTVHLTGLGRDFGAGTRRPVRALADVDLRIDTGSAVALMGPSGSGKSTLLHLVGGLDRPTGGSVVVDGVDVGVLRGRRLAAYRRTVGFVFQQFNLLPALSVLDNVLAPTIGGGDRRAAHARARDLLERVGLGAATGALPADLSGGEQQRAAIARALVNEPRLVLADEPTGALDTATGFEVVDLLLEIQAHRGATVCIATHDYAVAARTERIVTLRDGAVTGDRALGAPAEPRDTALRIQGLAPLA